MLHENVYAVHELLNKLKFPSLSSEPEDTNKYFQPGRDRFELLTWILILMGFEIDFPSDFLKGEMSPKQRSILENEIFESFLSVGCCALNEKSVVLGSASIDLQHGFLIKTLKIVDNLQKIVEEPEMCGSKCTIYDYVVDLKDLVNRPSALPTIKTEKINNCNFKEELGESDSHCAATSIKEQHGRNSSAEEIDTLNKVCKETELLISKLPSNIPTNITISAKQKVLSDLLVKQQDILEPLEPFAENLKFVSNWIENNIIN